MWRSRLQNISWLHHQMFYPYDMSSPAQARESDDLRHAMSPFSLLLSSFSGAQRILGYMRPWKTVAVGSSRNREKEDAFVWQCDVIGLQKGCRPWVETQRGRNAGNRAGLTMLIQIRCGGKRKSGNRTNEQMRRSSVKRERKKKTEQKLENTYNIKQGGGNDGNMVYSETWRLNCDVFSAWTLWSSRLRTIKQKFKII